MADDKTLSIPTTVEGIAALAGCALIVVAFVDYDAARGGIDLRSSPSYGMLVAGAVLVGVALIAYSMSRRTSAAKTDSSETYNTPSITVNVEQRVGPTAPARSAHDGESHEGTDSHHEGGVPTRRRGKSFRYPAGIDRGRIDEISAAVNGLSGTQKDLMVFFYSLHRPHLPFEQAYEFLEKAQSGRVASRDELYFRLKDLRSKDLIALETQVRNVSFVRLLPDVAATLEALDLLPSGGD